MNDNEPVGFWWSALGYVIGAVLGTGGGYLILRRGGWL